MFPQTEIDVQNQSGTSVILNQIDWARNYLCYEGMIDKEAPRGTWALTDLGKRIRMTDELAGRIIAKWVKIKKAQRERQAIPIIDLTPFYVTRGDQYDREDFLSEVFMSEEQLIQLMGLLKRKKNVILQGAPGVGKTFTAKRLVYVMMGVKDADRICYMIRQSLLPSTRQGAIRFSLFDEDSLPRLYERFILEYYRQHFPDLCPQSAMIPWDIPAETDPSMIRLLPGMRSDITLRNQGRTLIIDAKFYQRSLVRYMDKEMLRNANLYQIFAYVKNADKTNSGNVSGLLLYARTTEETEPFLSVVMGGNRIDVRSLDLNRPFQAISAALDAIAYACFGGQLRRIA